MPKNSPSLTGKLTTGGSSALGSMHVSATGQAMLNIGNAMQAITVSNHAPGIANGSGAWHSTTTTGMGGSFAAGSQKSSYSGNVAMGGADIIKFIGPDGNELVRLQQDGRVVWKHGTQLDEAAKVFSQVLRNGAAECAGIGALVRKEIRDQVYADLIALAKEKGNLSIEDLTFDRDSCIIVEKLTKST